MPKVAHGASVRVLDSLTSVSVAIIFYGVELLAPRLTPNLGDQGVVSSGPSPTD